MSKKKKTQKVGVITSEQLFDMQKPKFNAFACGHGAHGSKGYDRRKVKRQFAREEWQLTLVNSMPAAIMKIL